MLLLVRLGESSPVGEILPDRPIIQTFQCPVQTLYDVSILFATYTRINTATVEIKLTHNGALLVEQTLSAEDIADNSWVTLILPQPLKDCGGRELVLTIASPDASPGNAVTVWAYPSYYGGKLLEPQEPALTNRVIGVELNTSFYGLSQAR